MIELSDIEWGPIDASEYDEFFLEKYTEPVEISSLMAPEICIIPGEKGSGKTAFCKGLSLKHKADYLHNVKLKFDKIEFSAIVKSLAELASLTDTDSFTYICNYWQYVLVIKAIEKYFKEKTNNLTTNETIIKNYLLKKGLCERGVTGIMLILIDKCWSIIGDFTSPAKDNKKREDLKYEIMPSNLSPQVIEQVKDYPIFDPEFVHISSKFSEILKKRNSKIAITLDGLDRLNTKFEDKNKKNLQIIFDGLVQAVYDVSISKDFKECFDIKCLIPYDRFISLHLRDLDKIEDKTLEIRWTYNSLQNFLAKRINRHPKCKHLHSFSDLWNEVMPEKIYNNFYGLEEKTYDYILRHSMYRPRHLQIHLNTLAKKYPQQTIDKSMIGKSIRESSKKIAGNYIKEYIIDHPQMEIFLKKLKGKKNVMDYYSFRAIIEDIVPKLSPGTDIDKKIDTLYKMSFFGVIDQVKDCHDKIERYYKYMPPRKAGVKPYKVDFHYLSPKNQITKEVEDDDLIAIHPVFFDYCKLDPHDDYIIG